MDAGVVDEDINRRKLGLDARDLAFDGGGIGHVKGRKRHARSGHGRLHGVGGSGEFRGIAAVEDDSGAGLREAASEGEADALAGAGDERGAPREIEEGIFCGHRRSGDFDAAHTA